MVTLHPASLSSGPPDLNEVSTRYPTGTRGTDPA